MAGHRKGRSRVLVAQKRASQSRTRFQDRIAAVTRPGDQVMVAFDFFRAALKHALNRPETRAHAEDVAVAIAEHLAIAANHLLDAQLRSSHDR
ncbi:hypothetical protein GCM10023317_65350 [Actinopolymorpha pittospori]